MADKTNNTWFTWRNAANTADINTFLVDNNNDFYIWTNSGENLYINAGAASGGGASIQMGVGGDYSYSINAGGMTVAQGKAIDSYGTGFKICSSAAIKLGFWGATPIVQPPSTTDLKDVLVNTGLLAGGGVTPLDLDGGTLTAGGIVAPLVQNAQTGTTYTPVLGDAGKLVELSNAAAITLTVPPAASVAYAVGTQINLLQTGAGQVTVAPGSGVTVNGAPGLKLTGQWSSGTLIKRATNTWVLVGDLSS